MDKNKGTDDMIEDTNEERNKVSTFDEGIVTDSSVDTPYVDSTTLSATEMNDEEAIATEVIQDDTMFDENQAVSGILSKDTTVKKHKIFKFLDTDIAAKKIELQMKKEDAEQAIEEIKADVISTKKDSRLMLKFQSIRVKLISAFFIPVVLIIALGILSYITASKAIVSSFETSA